MITDAEREEMRRADAEIEAQIKFEKSEKSRAYYLANRDKIAAKHRAYYQANRDVCIAKSTEYRKSHPTESAAYHREYMAKWRATHE